MKKPDLPSMMFQNTGRKEEFNAIVQFRLWQPSVLPARIVTHTPWEFHLIHTWNERSVGGCVYYVAHPGVGSYDEFPINTYVAETRRMMRFWDNGYTPDVIIRPPLVMSLVSASENPLLTRFSVADV